MPPSGPSRLLTSLALVVALAAPCAAARTITARLPRVRIPPGGNVEACVFVRIPRREPFDMVAYDIRHRGLGGSFLLRHFLVWTYTGEQLAGFQPGTVVYSRGCLDLGPPDRDARQLIGSGPLRHSPGLVPTGLALRLAPVPPSPGAPADAIGILLDAEIVNGTTRERSVSSTVKLRAARRGRALRLLRPLDDRTAEATLLVAPDSVRSTEDATAAWNAAHPDVAPHVDGWMPATDTCVAYLAGRFHKRGLFLGVDLIGSDGTLQPPASGGMPNPFDPTRTHRYVALDYTDPGLDILHPPLPVRSGERLHTACWHDNGRNTPPRFGCEEASGVVPGGAAIDGGGPAKPCRIAGPDPGECPATDPALPGRSFTGICTRANVVAGTSVDDEICRLTGWVYDATPGVAGDAACDVGSP